MARLHWYALFVVCSLTIDFGIATPDPSEVFSINLSGEGSCSKYHDDQGNGQLDNVLAETQEIIHSTSTLVDGNYQTDWNYKARYLAASLFGLDPGPDNEEPSTGLDGEKLSKIREWFKAVDEELQTIPDAQEKKIRIYCDSTFMEFKDPDAYVFDKDGNHVDNGKGGFKTMKEEFSDTDTVDRYWMPHLKEYTTFKKEDWGRFDSYPGRPDFPTYCADASSTRRFALTMRADTGSRIITLCPSLFSKQSASDAIDLSAADQGTVLDNRESKSITVMHEMFHATLGTENSPDAYAMVAAVTKGGRLSKFFPDRKTQGFAQPKSGRDTFGAIDCMYLALYDKASTVDTDISTIGSTMNPESYAWFAAANYLSRKGDGNMDWSTGVARPDGSGQGTTPDVTLTQRHAPAAATSLTSVSRGSAQSSNGESVVAVTLQG